MKKTEAKAKAKDILLEAIGTAYYRLEGMEYDDLTDEEKDLITEYINQLGKKACKALGADYITY